MRNLAAVFAVCLWLALAPGVGAQGRPAVLAEVTPAEGTVGDALTYTATLTWPEGLQVLPPDPADRMGDCHVLDRQVGDLAIREGVQSLQVVLTIACYETGQLTLPAFEVRFTDPAGDSRVEKGPEVSVNIFRLLPEDAKEPRDIKGPEKLPPDLWTPLGIAAGVGFAVLLFYLLLVLLRRRRKKALEQKIQLPEPYAYAVERFASGRLETALDDGDLEGFYTELTDIVREYLEGRYGVQALEMSTTEILRALRKEPIDGFLLTDLRRLFEHADLSKFARIDPPPEAGREDLASGRDFVEKTRPQPLPEEQEEKGGPA